MDYSIKDAMVAISGAAPGLAGLILVFAGIIFTLIPSLQNEYQQRSYRDTARVALIPFCTTLFIGVLAVWWFNAPSDLFGHLIVTLFAAELLVVMAYGAWILYHILQ